jgi:hypothetical protein
LDVDASDSDSAEFVLKNTVREVSILVRLNAATPFAALLRSINNDKDELIRGSRCSGSIHVKEGWLILLQR